MLLFLKAGLGIRTAEDHINTSSRGQGNIIFWQHPGMFQMCSGKQLWVEVSDLGLEKKKKGPGSDPSAYLSWGHSPGPLLTSSVSSVKMFKS